MRVLTALLNWSPIPQRIPRRRSCVVVVVVDTVDEARHLGGSDVVVGAKVLRGIGRGSGVAVTAAAAGPS
jgi:hypothetical protein